MRLIYFGLPLGALCLSRAGFEPQVVCVSTQNPAGLRRLRHRLSRYALLLADADTADPHVQTVLSSVSTDVILSWYWPRRLPAEVLALAKRGAWGIHPSLLPRHRGPDPIFWTLHNGDERTGVTLHRLDVDYDTGNIVAQRSFNIPGQCNSWRLACLLDRLSLDLLVDTARRLASGELLEGLPQNESLATNAPQPSEDELSVRWRQPAAAIVSLIRAASPHPGAVTQLDQTTVEVLSADVYDEAVPFVLEPSEAICVDRGVLVRAADTGVLITRVRLPDSSLTLRGAQIHSLFGKK